MGRDGVQWYELDKMPGFNSRARMGRDFDKIGLLLGREGFNSRARMGRDPYDFSG